MTNSQTTEGHASGETSSAELSSPVCVFVRTIQFPPPSNPSVRLSLIFPNIVGCYPMSIQFTVNLDDQSDGGAVDIKIQTFSSIAALLQLITSYV